MQRPKSVEELAQELSCDGAALTRLLRSLATVELLDESLDGKFALTPVGELLADDAFGHLARYVGAEEQWAPWCRLADAVRTGHSAFHLWHGERLFDYLDKHPTQAETYHRGVDAFTRRQAHALVSAFDFSRFSQVADIGGGCGTLLVELLAAEPTLKGLLFDRPTVIADAVLRLADHPLSPRISFAGGSFFEEIPAGPDVFVIKHVLHNWDDEAAIRVLENCLKVLPPKGRILVIEGITLPPNLPDATRLLDLEMLAICEGGVERSKPEFRALFAAAGLKLVRTVQLVAGTRLLVGAPR